MMMVLLEQAKEMCVNESKYCVFEGHESTSTFLPRNRNPHKYLWQTEGNLSMHIYSAYFTRPQFFKKILYFN